MPPVPTRSSIHRLGALAIVTVVALPAGAQAITPVCVEKRKKPVNVGCGPPPSVNRVSHRHGPHHLHFGVNDKVNHRGHRGHAVHGHRYR